MRRFSFGNLLIDDANRAAVQVCRDIAERRTSSPQPVLLVGAPASGKTHLLYAVVDHVRKHYEPGETKYAILNPRKLPAEVREQVRGLVQNPAPIQNARYALLLVDQLETYTEETDQLEALVRVFLDSGHPVLLASDLDPEALPLPEGFRALLKSGQVVHLAPVEQAPGKLEQRVRQAHEDVLEEQRRNIETQRYQAEAAEESAQWRQRAEELRTEVADLRTQLQVARAMNKSLERQLEDMRVSLYEARSVAPSEEPLQALRAELLQAQGEVTRLTEESSGLRATLSQREETASADLQALRNELGVLRQSLDAAEARAEAAERSQRESAALRDELDVAKIELESDLQAVREELARAESRIQAAEAEKTTALHERLSIEEEARTLREDLDRAGGAARTEAENGARLAAEVAALTVENADLKDRLDNEQKRVLDILEQERREAQAQFEAHREQVSRSGEEAQARIQTLDAELTALRGQNAELREESERLVERAKRLVESIDANRARFSTIESEQRARIEELERAVEDRAAASAEELSTAQAQAQDALGQLSALQLRFEEERTRLQEAVRESRERVEADLARRDEELRGATANLEAARAETARLSDELAGLRIERDQLLAQVEQNKASHEAQLAEWRISAEKAAAEVESLRRETHEQSQTAATRIRELEERLEAIEHDAQARIAAATARSREVSGRFEAARQALTEQLQGVNEILAGATGLLRRATDSWTELNMPDPGELIPSPPLDEEPTAIEGSNSPSEPSTPKTQHGAERGSDDEDDWSSAP